MCKVVVLPTKPFGFFLRSRRRRVVESDIFLSNALYCRTLKHVIEHRQSRPFFLYTFKISSFRQ